MLDFFTIIKIVFIIVAIIFVIRDYKAKNHNPIPSTLMMVYFISISLAYGAIPKSIEIPFIYSALAVGIFASVFTSRFYRKINDKFRSRFFLVFAMFLCIFILLGAIGVIG